MEKRDIALWISVFSFIALIVSLSLLLADKFHVGGCGCPRVISHNFVFFFIALATIFVGSLGYYLASFKIEICSRIIDKNIKLIMALLDEDEKQAVNEIISAGGEILQSKLSKKFGKLKSHRVIKKLKNNGIVDVKPFRRTNKITLKPELIEELVK